MGGDADDDEEEDDGAAAGDGRPEAQLMQRGDQEGEEAIENASDDDPLRQLYVLVVGEEVVDALHSNCLFIFRNIVPFIAVVPGHSSYCTTLHVTRGASWYTGNL